MINLNVVRTWHRLQCSRLALELDRGAAARVSRDASDDALAQWLTDIRPAFALSTRYLTLVDTHAMYRTMVERLRARHLTDTNAEARKHLQKLVQGLAKLVAMNIDDFEPEYAAATGQNVIAISTPKVGLHAHTFETQLAGSTDEIDQQHRELFRMFRQLQLYADETTNAERVITAVCNLSMMLADHFDFEEELIRARGCPKDVFESHAQGHMLILETVTNIEIDVCSGKVFVASDVFGAVLSAFLVDVVALDYPAKSHAVAAASPGQSA